jgi:hypothetical protein
MKTIAKLWDSISESDWKDALKNYWKYVNTSNLELERELNGLSLKEIIALDEKGWYNFLHDKYFRWKYTVPLRYTQTIKHLEKYREQGNIAELFSIKLSLLSLDLSDIQKSILIAKQIYGLGIAGASGLISIMYPHAFGTVDKYVAEALYEITTLPEHHEIEKIKIKIDKSDDCSLTLNEGVLLIEIMRRKAKKNNLLFKTDYWTPRKIDMVLWGART